MKISKRRFIPVAVALIAILAISGAAYAYWTSSGTGSGTGSTADGVTSLTASSPDLDAMYPGDTDQDIVITVHNPTSQTVYVTSVAVTVTTDKDGCTAADFTLTGAPVAVGAEIGAGADLVLTGVPTIKFFDDPVRNQDVCQNAAVTLTFTIS